jgi:hypothetical protein
MVNPNHKNTLLDLFNLPDKKAVQKFCRNAVITIEEFASVTMAAGARLLGPYRYARHFVELVPEHLNPTADDIGVLGTPEGEKTMRKVSQMFKDRRKVGVHLFFLPSKERWHLLYFDQRDMSGTNNHWKAGPHVHYSRESYTNDPLDTVWTRICAKRPEFPAAEHLRYLDRPNREHGFIGPGDG